MGMNRVPTLGALSRRGLVFGGALGVASLVSTQTWPLGLALGPKPKVIANPMAYQKVHTVGLDPMPELEVAFADFKASGYAGVELYPYNLRIDGAVEKLATLIARHELPLTGCSFTGAMWQAEQASAILADARLLTSRLVRLGGKTITLNVGDAGRRKTEAELDVQARTLSGVLAICREAGLRPALHNHVHELADDMAELEGMIARVPDLPLGPDLNWVMRAKVDPVAFIRRFGPRIVHLHLRDQDADGRWTEALGEGITDFPAIATALRQAGFGGYAAVELMADARWPARLGLKGAYAESRRYMRSVFGW